MDALAGPFYAAAALLVVAGVQKVADPAPLVRALRSLHLPGGRALVRIFAAAEVAIGLAALATGGRWAAAAVAASYLLFTAVVVLALTRGGVLSSCGCFGKADTPPTALHVAVTGGLAVAAGLVAARPIGTLPDVLGAQALAGVPLLAGTVALAAVVYVALAVHPQVQVQRLALRQPRRLREGAAS